MSDRTPTPFILDTSVVTAVARADPDIIGLIQGYDGRNQPMVIPSLAITGASLDTRNEEADDLLAGLELLDNLTIAPLNGADQAARLAEVIARTGHAADLEEPLHIREIADPDERYPEH